MFRKIDTQASKSNWHRTLWLAVALTVLCSLIQFNSARCVAAQAGSKQPVRQRPKVASGFQGNWEGGTFSTDKSHAPTGVNVKKQPANQVSLTLTQKGQVVSGEYGASIRWGRRFESGEFSTKLNGNTATVTLKSGWGGQITVHLFLQGNRLVWRVIKAEDENYFPTSVTLHRSK